MHIVEMMALLCAIRLHITVNKVYSYALFWGSFAKTSKYQGDIDLVGLLIFDKSPTGLRKLNKLFKLDYN